VQTPKPPIVRTPISQPVIAPVMPVRPTVPGPSASRPFSASPNISQLMPLIQSLNANPAALEKIKNEHPQVYRQLQTQLGMKNI
jgi:hypothetical protein